VLCLGQILFVGVADEGVTRVAVFLLSRAHKAVSHSVCADTRQHVECLCTISKGGIRAFDQGQTYLRNTLAVCDIVLNT
jgi:hypothetical protein